MPPQLQIRIKPDGTIETVVNGVSGPSCKDATAWLATIGSVVDETPTDDYYKPDEQGLELNGGLS